jgi:hypothetical protein
MGLSPLFYALKALFLKHLLVLGLLDSVRILCKWSSAGTYRSFRGFVKEAILAVKHKGLVGVHTGAVIGGRYGLSK